MRKNRKNGILVKKMIEVIKYKKKWIDYTFTAFFAVLIIYMLQSNLNYGSYIKRFFLEMFSEVGSIIAWPFDFIDRESTNFINNIYYKKLNELEDENIKLKEQVIGLQNDSVEYEKLKKLLNFKEDYTYKQITSSIVKTSIDYNNKSFIVNVGSNSGVKSGCVVALHNQLVGKIVEAANSYSLVQVITDQNARTPVIFNTSNIRGILIGNNLSHDLLDVGYCYDPDHVEDGEAVITSGDGLIYPRGIVVGKVKKEGDNMKVLINLKISSLDYVSILCKD